LPDLDTADAFRELLGLDEQTVGSFVVTGCVQLELFSQDTLGRAQKFAFVLRGAGLLGADNIERFTQQRVEKQQGTVGQEVAAPAALLTPESALEMACVLRSQQRCFLFIDQIAIGALVGIPGKENRIEIEAAMICFRVEREIGGIGNPDALEKAVSFDSGADFVAECRAKLGEGSPPPVWVFRCVYFQRGLEDRVDRFWNSPYASTLANTRSLDVGANRQAPTAKPLFIDPDRSVGERSA